jgi:signal transduction histidine kinase
MSGAEQVHRRLEDLYELSQVLATFDTVEKTFDSTLAIAARSLPLRSAVLTETEGSDAKTYGWPSESQAAVVAAGLDERFIVLPLVVAQRPPFGALQLEGERPFDQADLIFSNAVATQLAIALARERRWRRDITRREHAEQERTVAEERRILADASRVAAEKDRVIAERSSDKYEALASENARLLKEAQQAVRVREQVLAVVSHDLKSPLGAILMTTDALAKKAALPEPVARIQRAAKRMLRLIDDLLDFASIEAGHLAIRRRAQSPGQILQETLAGFESIARDAELHLTVEIDPDLPDAHCDRDRILQVLSNLVGNATKATVAGGRLTLKVQARDGELLFSVSDSGPGISAEDAEHLFERYWRGGEVEYKGTGLGLAIARGIVNAHGGRIWVESELGRGATFLFTVPVVDATALFVLPSKGT